MRVKVHISGGGPKGVVDPILRKLGKRPNDRTCLLKYEKDPKRLEHLKRSINEESFCDFFVYTDDHVYHWLMSALEDLKGKEGIIFTKRDEYVFTKQEMEQAEYYRIIVTAACSDANEEYGNEFKKTRLCNNCGWTEVEQLGNLIIDYRSFGSKDIALSYDNYVFVTSRVVTCPLFWSTLNVSFFTFLRPNPRV
jgi:hypothetical protein